MPLLYNRIQFPYNAGWPYFFTNYVSTIDGKTNIKGDKRYWPIGTLYDYKIFIELRSHSDVVIHGKNSALGFRTVDNLAKDEFKNRRKALGKTRDILYIVITSRPTADLTGILENSHGIRPLIATTKEARIPPTLAKIVDVKRFGEGRVDLRKLSIFLHKNGYNVADVEGGSHLVASLVAEKLLDEIFLTIAPKVYGSREKISMTMIEGQLFDPAKIPQFTLISVKKHGDEVFLRYRKKK